MTETTDTVLGFEIEIQVKRIRGLIVLPNIEWDHSHSNEGDVQVTDLNADLGSYFGVDSGVLVLKAGEESALEAGDVIVAVGDQNVESATELYERLKDASGSVTVQRDGKTIELSIAETLDGLRLEREVRIFSRRSDRNVQSTVLVDFGQFEHVYRLCDPLIATRINYPWIDQPTLLP